MISQEDKNVKAQTEAEQTGPDPEIEDGQHEGMGEQSQ